MIIKHAKLGDLEISYEDVLLIEIENKKIEFDVKYLEKGKQIIKFYEQQEILGNKVPGIKLTEEEYYEILNFKEKSIQNLKVEKYKSIVGFSWLATEQIYTINNYSYEIIENAQEIIKERYEYKTEVVKTIAGKVSKIIVSDITGAEVLEILEEVSKKNIEKQNKKKYKESKRIEELKIKAKETGKRQIVSVSTDDCNDDDEACEVDTLTEYVNANGKFTIERTHNW